MEVKTNLMKETLISAHFSERDGRCSISLVFEKEVEKVVQRHNSDFVLCYCNDRIQNFNYTDLPKEVFESLKDNLKIGKLYSIDQTNSFTEI